MPATLTMFTRGEITARQADAIAEASWRLPLEVLAEFERRVLARACSQTLRSLKDTIRRVLTALDPLGAEQRRQAAAATRSVTRHAGDDGMAELGWWAPADQVQDAWARASARARAVKIGAVQAGDARTLDQIRSDLFHDALRAALPIDGLPSAQGRRPVIHVHVAAATLLGRDDAPGYLEGYGPLTAQQAREIAGEADATWRRILTDPVTGLIAGVESRAYRPPQSMIDAVLARDQRCAFPTCHQPAWRCDLDHITPHGHGTTSPANLAP